MKISNSAQRIQELMEMYNLSQNDLSKKVGLNRSVISLYVRGKREPRQDNIYNISKAFDIDPAWLMGYDVPIKNESYSKTRNYTEKLANMLNKVKESEDLQDLIEKYISLPELQQIAIKTILESMLNK